MVEGAVVELVIVIVSVLVAATTTIGSLRAERRVPRPERVSTTHG